MKTSQKPKFLALLAIILMLGMTSYDAFAFERHRRPNNPGSGGGHVGAPLDGGILTILLGGAGVAYFSMRKKKKGQQ